MQVLEISASGRHEESVSRMLAREIVAGLEAGNDVTHSHRDLADGLPFVDAAWIDMIARARLTFRYTADGPVGLLADKKAYVVVASGGVAIGSPADFATPYLRHALRFLGIADIEFIAAEKLNQSGEDAIDTARVRIAKLLHTRQPEKKRAA